VSTLSVHAVNDTVNVPTASQHGDAETSTRPPFRNTPRWT
jgi:hypothetical protein